MLHMQRHAASCFGIPPARHAAHCATGPEAAPGETPKPVAPLGTHRGRDAGKPFLLPRSRPLSVSGNRVTPASNSSNQKEADRYCCWQQRSCEQASSPN